ncbi:MAG TPA: hypothetical protein VGC92_05100 [Phenylobacterium sp.]|jgi:hypothetical protein
MRGVLKIDRTVLARGRKLGFAMAVAAGLAGGAPAHAQFGDILRGAASQLQNMPKPKPAAAKPSTPGATSSGTGAPAMGLQAGTALPPLHKLGTDAVAVVEAASAGAPVRQMDYLFARQTVALGPKGTMTVSYLSGCLTEQIAGGTVTIDAGGSRVSGGKLAPRTTPGCKAARPVILASASEAGATVNRITPFTAANWDERTLKGGPPVFKWAAAGPVTLRVKDMDKPGEPVVWQGQANADWIAYPASGAPALAPGEPFKAEVMAGDRVLASALFSIDPALDVADSLANRVVPLSAP